MTLLVKYMDLWTGEQWWQAVTQPYVDMMGFLFPLLIGLAVMGALWIEQRDLAGPSVVGILIGLVMIPLLPPVAARGALAVLAIGLAGALYSAISATRGRR